MRCYFYCLLLLSLAFLGCAKNTSLEPVSGKQYKSNSYYYVALSNLESYRGDLDLLIKHLQEGLKNYPDVAYLHYLLAERYIETRQFSLAVEELDKSRTLNADSVDVEFLLARLYQVEGKNEEARKLFESVNKKDPDKEEATLQLATLQVELKQYQEALSILNQFIQRDPQAILSHFYAGLIYSKHLKEYKKAIESYQKILEWDPDNVRVRLAIAQIYLDENKTEKGLEEFLEVEKIDPNDLSVQLQIAQL